MNLQDRLEQAREEYRSLVPPADTDESPRSSRRHRWPVLVAAAAILIATTAGLVLWSGRDDAQKVTAIEPPTPEPTSVPVEKAPDPPGAAARYDQRVAIVEPGPYSDGQVVTVRVPDGFAGDLLNGGAQLCAVVSDSAGGPSETCDPLRSATGLASTFTETAIVLHRSVFTPTGMRDCNEPEITCRVVVRAAAGNEPTASPPLSFDDATTPEGEARVDASPTGRPGEFQVSFVGITPHASWTQLRASDPDRAAEITPLYLEVCAFDPAERTDGPFGEYLWSFSPGDEILPPANCAVFEDQIRIDPDRPEDPVVVTPPTWILGYGGWSDCRSNRCFVQVRRAVVTDGDESIAAALLDADGISTAGMRPTLEIDTAGPHRAGQEITVRVAGLRNGEATNIGVCDTEHPWQCGYIGSVFGQIDNGVHTFTLPDSLACPPRSCFLELDAQGEGVAPLAFAPLDTPT